MPTNWLAPPITTDSTRTIRRICLPVAPANRSREISRFLSVVIATLLAKRPAGRFESADVLHTILTEAEQSAFAGRFIEAVTSVWHCAQEVSPCTPASWKPDV